MGRRGNANFTNLADFVRLIHQNITEKAEIELKALLPSCSVPSLLRITVLHTAGREARQGELGLLVVGVRATMVEETWTWSCTSLHCPERQSFLLRSEVEWVEVPEVWADKNTSRCNTRSFCTSKDPHLAVILIIAHICHNRHNRRWCIFSKLVYFLAKRTQNVGQIWQILAILSRVH